jgi:hypothetical protein
MSKRILTTTIAAAIMLGPLAGPALADGAASTRNILIGVGAAAAVGITNYNHKKRVKQAELREQTRRQASYRAYFYHKYGYYPTDQQFRDWYVRTYGVQPS